MTNQQLVNAVNTAMSALISEGKPNSKELVLAEFILEAKELLTNPMFDSLKTDGLNKGLFVIENNKPIVTIKGADMLFGSQKVVVTKRIPPAKMNDKALVETFLTASQEICFRIENSDKFPDFATQFKKDIKLCVTAYNCVGDAMLNVGNKKTTQQLETA